MTRLLLVDDDDSNRLTTSVLLEDEGFEVAVACSFDEARQVLATSEPRFDAVLLDHHLGDGLGTALVPLVRARDAATKVILISGSVADDELIAVRFDALVTKGAHFPDVLALLKRTLAG